MNHPFVIMQPSSFQRQKLPRNLKSLGRGSGPIRVSYIVKTLGGCRFESCQRYILVLDIFHDLGRKTAKFKHGVTDCQGSILKRKVILIPF